MPSFTSRNYTPDRFRSLSKPDDDLMDDITDHIATRPRSKTAGTTASSLTLVPSDGSLLDYFDLPSPPSTPHRPTHSLSYSSLNSFPSPATNPYHPARGSGSPSSFSSLSLSGSSSSMGTLTPPTSSPPTSTLPRWPTASQRMHHHRLPTRPRSRSTSSSASSSGSASSSNSFSSPDIEMTGTNNTTTRQAAPPPAAAPLIRQARRTPYYPPNASRNVDRARVYMNRGPHFVPNWTPLTSLPRHVQLKIEERMVRFTAG